MRDTVYWLTDSLEAIQCTTLNKSWLIFLPKVVTSIENLNDNDGVNIVLKDLVKEVPDRENCNADNMAKR